MLPTERKSGLGRQLVEILEEIVLTYSYRNRTGNLVFCWDNERYINHSFKPNCCLTPYNFEIAIRDIEIGEELTNDYGMLNIIAPFSVDTEGTGRSTVYPDDLLRYSSEWDQLLGGAFARFLQVPQPLKDSFSATHWHQAEQIARGEVEPASSRSLLFVKDR